MESVHAQQGETRNDSKALGSFGGLYELEARLTAKIVWLSGCNGSVASVFAGAVAVKYTFSESEQGLTIPAVKKVAAGK